jgi:hypothetical protein
MFVFRDHLAVKWKKRKGIVSGRSQRTFLDVDELNQKNSNPFNSGDKEKRKTHRGIGNNFSQGQFIIRKNLAVKTAAAELSCPNGVAYSSLRWDGGSKYEPPACADRGKGGWLVKRGIESK